MERASWTVSGDRQVWLPLIIIWCFLFGCLSQPSLASQHSVQHPTHIHQSLDPLRQHEAAAAASLALPPLGQPADLPTASSSSTTSSSSSSSRTGSPGAMQRLQHTRQLLHLESTDSVDSIDTAEAAEAADVAAMYPRDPSSVQKYLLEGLQNGPHEIPVWFVVVTDPSQPRSIISQPQAEQQVQLLNRAYATGLPARKGVVSEDAAAPGASRQLWRFRLMGVRYTSSKTPMCIGSKLENDIKAVFHPQLVEATRSVAGQKGYSADRTMIVYTSDLTSPACKGYVPGYKALFGWSNTPMELQVWKERRQAYRDGVVLDFRYLFHPDAAVNEAGGKALRGSSTGAQLVHEVGHYLGLLHTFVGGCSASGGQMTDGVDDTPAEAHPRSWGVDLGDASGGCSTRDTCPGVPGHDAVDNYMSYNNLACASTFTPGQQARMLFLFNSMRAGATN